MNHEEKRRLRRLFVKLQRAGLDKPRRKTTFMEVAGIEHREVTISKILAFLLCSEEEHGLGDLWARSLMAAAAESDERFGLEAMRVSPTSCTTEVVTANVKRNLRIDVVVESPDFVVGVENKIGASLYNDLEAYAGQVRDMAGDRVPFLLTLTLHNEAVATSEWAASSERAGVALANVTVVNTSADASGKVNSLLKANSANFRAKDVNVTTTYDADSDAVVKATGATVGGFNASFNSAQTDTTVNATAKLINDNSYLAFNSLKVAVNGKVASDADAQTPTWQIGFGNVAANRSTANANVNQTAAVENRKGGIMANGEVNVLSEISDTHANASVGSSANSKSVGLIDGAVNKANAYEKVNSTASVTGANALLSAGRTLNVKSVANNVTQANA